MPGTEQWAGIRLSSCPHDLMPVEDLSTENQHSSLKITSEAEQLRCKISE